MQDTEKTEIAIEELIITNDLKRKAMREYVRMVKDHMTYEQILHYAINNQNFEKNDCKYRMIVDMMYLGNL